MHQSQPDGSPFFLYFVQCAACGAPFAVQEFKNITAMLIQQNKAIKAIAAKAGVSVTLDT